MTNKELMQWYMDWWKKQFPDYDRCELVENGNKIYIRVHRKAWQSKDSTIKSLDDAQYAYKKANGQITPKKSDLNLSVKLPFNDKPKKARVFKTVGCNIDLDFYNEVKKVCDSHNMTIHELIKTLLKQAIGK